MLGGGLRLPKVQERISEALGGRELSFHLNPDEAMAFGTAFMASNSSSSFKVRKLYLTDGTAYPIYVNITDRNPEVAEKANDDDEPFFLHEQLFKEREDYGTTYTISVTRLSDLKARVYGIHPRTGLELPLMDFLLNNVTNITTFEGNCTTPELELKFILTKYGSVEMKATIETEEEYFARIDHKSLREERIRNERIR